MNDYEKQVFRSAISKYGEINQIVLATAEEMADAGIMLDQLSIMEQNADRVRKRRNEKVRRLKVRVMGKGG